MKVLLFKVDPVIREYLAEVGLSYVQASNVPRSSVKHSDNTFQTRSRVHTENRDLVDEYREHMLEGHVFPEVLLARIPGQKKLVIVCGKHRFSAATKAGWDVLSQALIVEPADEADMQRVRDVSWRDNHRHGLRTTREDVFRHLADEAIQSNGGAHRGYPPNSILQSLAKRNGSKGALQGIKKAVNHKLFAAKCIAKKLVPPAAANVCDVAYQFLEREGFEELLETVCRYHKSRNLFSVLKDCKARKLDGFATAKAIRDAASGYAATPRDRMRPIAKLRLAAGHLANLLKSEMANASAVSAEDLEEAERIVEELCCTGADCISAARKLVVGGDQ